MNLVISDEEEGHSQSYLYQLVQFHGSQWNFTNLYQCAFV